MVLGNKLMALSKSPEVSITKQRPWRNSITFSQNAVKPLLHCVLTFVM